MELEEIMVLFSSPQKKVKGEIPVTIDIQAYVTTQQIKKRLDMMDADQYRQLVKQGKPGAIDYGYDTRLARPDIKDSYFLRN